MKELDPNKKYIAQSFYTLGGAEYSLWSTPFTVGKFDAINHKVTGTLMHAFYAAMMSNGMNSAKWTRIEIHECSPFEVSLASYILLLKSKGQY